MTYKALVVCLLFFSACYALEEPRTVTISASQKSDLTPHQLAEYLSDAQPEIMRKSVLHFINNQINALLKTKSANSVKQEVLKWFTQQGIAQLNSKLSNYMRERLFKKLQMEKLSESFKRQIEDHPEDYFLTYDMYDLLIDE